MRASCEVGPGCRHKASSRRAKKLTRCVDRLQDLAVAFKQGFTRQDRQNIGKATVGRIPVGIRVEQPVGLFQTRVQGGAGQGDQQRDHGVWNGNLSDEVDLPVEDVFAIVIKTQNKASGDHQAGVLEGLHRIGQRALDVLVLPGLFEAVDRRRFQAEKKPS